ncbi:MarR family winged helix-turn-helix transcriptional regulator [Thermasporomyces composti]|jgi:DNA-binding MarR family transcriptional regulator|uniref:MarR family transcriptional regulator n=1 Tax=Thermasporomyces composti TaxID=696763 RepID=A0A3D9VF23_THECX|nr:MarR family transcriptional regulator [Thermasporomyces composti]REF37745.1 MarR family transcriptional regulator [Thermasporomyces composti]
MATVRWLTAEQQRVWRNYLVGTACLMERLENDLRGIGLSLAEYEIMVRLSEAPERTLRMAELAASVHHSRSRLTHTVCRMEAMGLVERLPCPSDRRGVLARLTDAGYARLVEAAPIHVAGVREAFVDLVSPEDFAAIGRAFEAVRRASGCEKDCGVQEPAGE